MAVQSPSAKLSAQQAKLAADKANKMHRRSRSGCFTCRLRRKKCDEGKPGCTACSKLSIQCEYKRPMWWGNADLRRQHKENIKNQIKSMKIAEKQAAAQHMPLPTPPSSSMSMGTPPSLYHSPSDEMCRKRGASIDSTFSSRFDFNGNIPIHPEIFATQPMSSAQAPGITAPFGFQPFNDCWKLESQYFVNDVESRRDSTISTTCFKPLPASEDQPFMDNWVQEETYEHRQELLVDDQIDFGVFDFSTPAIASVMLPSQPAIIPHPVKVERRDEYLLHHFQTVVAPMVFPMLKLNDSHQPHTDLLITPLKSNQAYYHAALSYAAVHIKATHVFVTPELEEDLLRHVQETVKVITGWLSGPTNCSQIAEATLAMIYLRGLVGGPDQDGCELPWLSHFQAAKDALARMDVQEAGQTLPIAAWVDILGSTMTGSKPTYSDMYRENNVANTPLGLSRFAGCDDSILYLISEIACLESYKQENTIDDITLCFHIKSLGDHISANEISATPPANVYTAHGSVDGIQLAANMSHVYRIAARIYLCSLLPDFDPSQSNVQNLVDSLADALSFIPAGINGFDRSLVWPLLIAGSVARADSSLRNALVKRAELLEIMAGTGAFGRMRTVLSEVWKINDGQSAKVHWRDVMKTHNWEFLLI